MLLPIVLLVAMAVVLWVAALVGPLSATGRFRALGAAVALTVILGAQAIGWPWTLALAALSLWIAAIVRGVAPA